MKPGEICWAELPFLDGREQSGRRPCVILQDDGYAAKLPTVLLIPVTSNKTAFRFAGSVKITASANNGLTLDSVALVFQLRSLDRRRIEDPIGALECELLNEIYQRLDRLMGRPSS